MPNFYKKLLVEITFFVSIVTLAGHVTVNIWERYVVQNKLSEMKNSIDHLKVTVNNMGYAYDDLQRDLIDLARINFKIPTYSHETLRKEPSKKKEGLDDKIMEHLKILLTKVNNKAHELLLDKNTGSAHVPNKTKAKNAMTITRFPITVTAVGSGPVTTSKEKRDEIECIYNHRTKNSERKCKEDCERSNVFYQKI